MEKIPFTENERKAVLQIFPQCNFEKSKIIAAFGNESWSEMVVKIYRRGTFRIDQKKGRVILSKRIE